MSAAEELARRHFDALREAGLTSWTFEEFFAFCAPLAVQACVPAALPAIDDAASVKAGKLADAVSNVLRNRYGQSLSDEACERIRNAAKRAIVARHRRNIQLAPSPPR